MHTRTHAQTWTVCCLFFQFLCNIITTFCVCLAFPASGGHFFPSYILFKSSFAVENVINSFSYLMFPWPLLLLTCSLGWNLVVLLYLTSFHRQKEVKAECTDVGGVYEQGHRHLPTRITTGTKPDVTESVRVLVSEKWVFCFSSRLTLLWNLRVLSERENMVWLRHRGRLRIH